MVNSGVIMSRQVHRNRTDYQRLGDNDIHHDFPNTQHLMVLITSTETIRLIRDGEKGGRGNGGGGGEREIIIIPIATLSPPE